MGKENFRRKDKLENGAENVKLGSGSANIREILNSVERKDNNENNERKNNGGEEKPTKKKPTIVKSEKETNLEELNEFEQFLERAKKGEVPKSTQVVYVDKEIHNLLQMLKMQGVPISKLVNVLLLDWIQMYQEELTNLIKKNNKYL